MLKLFSCVDAVSWQLTSWNPRRDCRPFPTPVRPVLASHCLVATTTRMTRRTPTTDRRTARRSVSNSTNDALQCMPSTFLPSLNPPFDLVRTSSWPCCDLAVTLLWLNWSFFCATRRDPGRVEPFSCLNLIFSLPRWFHSFVSYRVDETADLREYLAVISFIIII